MYPVSILALGFVASASTALANIQCGTSPSSLALRSVSERMQKHRRGIEASREHLSIKTYLHIVADDETVETGYIGDDIVEREMQYLNNAFASHDISFKLIETDRTVNRSWTRPDGNPVEPGHESDMRKALRKGGYSDLNIFFTPWLVPAGRCDLPRPYPTGEDVLNDGCLVKAQNDRDEDPSDPKYYDVIVHEVGHWLGLDHTFAGGCEGSGDDVDDTPAEAYPSLDDGGCPEKDRDTCPDLPGFDPIDNHMTYVAFECGPLRFTPGQVDRMHNLWLELRAPFVKNCTGPQ